ncbi:hypothetical protein WA026_021838, partial [Henosepilachna vigintioctopunctata]
MLWNSVVFGQVVLSVQSAYLVSEFTQGEQGALTILTSKGVCGHRNACPNLSKIADPKRCARYTTLTDHKK